MNTHENYNGVFIPNDDSFSGHVHISGAESCLRLVGSSPW